MSKADEYRRNAEECERMARSATNPDVKSHWLRLAEAWLRMIPRTPGQSAEDAFEAEVKAKRTGQSDSTSSH